MTIGEALELLKSKLTPSMAELACPQSEQILEFVLNCSRTDLYLHRSSELDNTSEEKMRRILSRALKGEPLAYITGKVYFYSREFTVNPDVLIPRPDTETLVEQVLANEKSPDLLFADIGTGSGIISCILTEHNKGWKAVAVDLSFKALKTAAINCGPGIDLVCADMLSAFKNRPLFDFVVSNPPYISAKEMETLDNSVTDFEPRTALYGGKDGLDYYRLLAADSPGLLKSNGHIYCEIGYDQGEYVKEVFLASGWSGVVICKDLGGNPRVMRATRPEKP